MKKSLLIFLILSVASSMLATVKPPQFSNTKNYCVKIEENSKIFLFFSSAKQIKSFYTQQGLLKIWVRDCDVEYSNWKLFSTKVEPYDYTTNNK